MVDQLDTVLVRLRLHRLSALWSFVHLEENRDVGPLSVLPVAVRVNLEPPSDAVGEESWRVDGLLGVA